MRIRGLEKREARWTVRWMYALMKRQFGKVLTPFTVMARRPPVAIGFMVANVAIETSKGVPAPLKRLVCLRAAQLIGCPF
jgi:alkylhydroperoxidase family enzyme